MIPAVLTFAFDPVVGLTPTASVRIETLAVAGILLAGLVLAARIGRLTPAVGPYVPAPGLRADDLLFIAVGTVPGAILGGRLGYVLDHLDYYRANPNAMADFMQGGMNLTLAVPLGILTGAIIARLIGAPVARWMHAAAFPMLFILSAAKLAAILGADGQGQPSDVAWATAYLGPGPWGSLAPEVASHPSQAYEAILVLAAIGVLIAVSRFEVVARRDGGALFVALACWAFARFVVAFTWRDVALLGPLRIDQVLSLLIVALALLGLIERGRAPIRYTGWTAEGIEPEPAE